MITVKLYSRQDCSLCDQAISDLQALQTDIPHRLEIIDVEDNPEIFSRYGAAVPVVEVGPYKLNAPFDRKELEITLGAVRRGAEQDLAIAQDRQTAQLQLPSANVWTKADQFSYWLSRHYLAVLNLVVFIYVGLPFLAPVLMKAGITGPAYGIYRVYGAVCHQLAFRSWFLFGEQSAYPRASAGVPGLIPFGAATGIDEQDLLAARQFIGNSQIGYKVAFCERDVAIYAAILLFGLIYVLTNRKLPAFPWYLWIVIGMVPIGIDGVTQLISQPPFNLLPYHESTPFLRALTGGLFGFTTAWFGYPLVEESMLDTKQYLSAKFNRLKSAQNVKSVDKRSPTSSSM
jgi:uncharacterized membrane protein